MTNKINKCDISLCQIPPISFFSLIPYTLKKQQSLFCKWNHDYCFLLYIFPFSSFLLLFLITNKVYYNFPKVWLFKNWLYIRMLKQPYEAVECLKLWWQKNCPKKRFPPNSNQKQSTFSLDLVRWGNKKEFRYLFLNLQYI